MSRSRVHLVRHGEVDNPGGVLYGRLQGFGLTALGIAMGERLADHFDSASFDVAQLRCSPLQRAQETIAPVRDRLGLPVVTDARVIEADSVFEGLDLQRNPTQLAHPRHWKHFRNPLRPSWQEPFVEQVKRMTAAVRDSLAAARGRDAVIVSHQSPIWVLRRALEGRSALQNPRARQCTLGSVTTLTFERSTLVGLDYCEPCGDLMAKAVAIT